MVVPQVVRSDKSGKSKMARIRREKKQSSRTHSHFLSNNLIVFSILAWILRNTEINILSDLRKTVLGTI